MKALPWLVAPVFAVGCAAPAPSAPSTATPPTRTDPAPVPSASLSSARPNVPSVPAGAGTAPNAPDGAEAPSSAPVAGAVPPGVASATPAAPTFEQLQAQLRSAGFAALADILGVRVTQTRRKMKLTEDEATRAAQELLDQLPKMPEVRKLLVLMPKASIELVRSVRERGVPEDEAERMADYLVEVRAALDMDNTAAFDENCSHVVGREWQDIDYRDEGMKWERQKSIYVPKGVLHFKDVANLRQFFRVESKAPYFQKVYGVKGSVP